MKRLFVICMTLLALFSANELVMSEPILAKTAMPKIQVDVPKNAHCEVCNMDVYQENHKMGKFSAKAVTSEGEVLYYDDIGCLVFDEVRKKAKYTKYVRDYQSSKWIKVESAIIVQANLKSPMNWGYIYFSKREEANAYIAKNKKTKIVQLSAIKKEATKRYEKQFPLKTTTKKSADASTKATGLNQDVPNHTNCAFCDMVVYQKDSPFGMFSAQAIQKNGKVLYYDDISCLLYDEVKKKASYTKYVRDFETLDWILADKATYVKTTLHSPMDDGYIFFAKKEQAQKYVAKNKNTKIVTYQAVKKEAIQRYE